MNPLISENRRRTTRPWGYFDQFTQEQPSTVKIITINPGEEFSLQTHQRRDEFWRIISGEGVVIIGDATMSAHPGAEFWASRTTPHRASASGAAPLCILEISFGSFNEGDIVRLKDKYGRT